MFSQKIINLAEKIIKTATIEGMTITTAESCTGGLVIAALTEISGSSAVVDRGFITYTNEAKIEMLGVKSETLDTQGAVSEQTVREMAVGAKIASGSSIAISVSGVAGPTGGTADKPVGLVHFALASDDGVISQQQTFTGDREAVRAQTVEAVLNLILTYLKTA